MKQFAKFDTYKLYIIFLKCNLIQNIRRSGWSPEQVNPYKDFHIPQTVPEVTEDTI